MSWAGTSPTRSGCSEPCPTWPGVLPGMGHTLQMSGHKGKQRLQPHGQQGNSAVTTLKKRKIWAVAAHPGTNYKPSTSPTLLLTTPQSPGDAWKWIASLPAQRKKNPTWSIVPKLRAYQILHWQKGPRGALETCLRRGATGTPMGFASCRLLSFCHMLCGKAERVVLKKNCPKPHLFQRNMWISRWESSCSFGLIFPPVK